MIRVDVPEIAEQTGQAQIPRCLGFADHVQSSQTYVRSHTYSPEHSGTPD